MDIIIIIIIIIVKIVGKYFFTKSYQYINATLVWFILYDRMNQTLDEWPT